MSSSAAICELTFTKVFLSFHENSFNNNKRLNVCYNFSHSNVLKARPANPGFQVLLVPQGHQEHQELKLLLDVPDFPDDGSSVLGNTITQRMAETVDKYM